MYQTPFNVVFLVPTGIGATIGGYAGDALPILRTLAGVVDRVITHPNVLNGAMMYWPIPNAFYVEGYALDRFAEGKWGLAPVRQNRIGLLLDSAIEPDLQLRHLQAAEAARATLGLTLTPYLLTDQPLGVNLQTAPSGASWGTITNPGSLLRGAEKLIKEGGAEAIAVVARFPDDVGSLALQNYRQGQGVDPVAGAEAIISHLIVRQFRLPCAHAPALAPLPVDPQVSPRSAAEELGYTFLPCVLVGLARAPQLVTTRTPGQIWSENVDAIITPASACGGSALLSLSNTLVIAVTENETLMAVPPESLRIRALRVRSYWEAIGVLAAWRSGVNLEILAPSFPPLQELGN